MKVDYKSKCQSFKVLKVEPGMCTPADHTPCTDSRKLPSTLYL
jgi:hypothetical protein